ncbi:hypothetical protein GCL60_06540 [Silvanigrella paludirubra]|uniref:Uncharacterized protein n=1 Tax=Silvanigrella paludirubra TaxID=2499159 RepID=A0A6N6VU98_9BACT|nr:hypothetical protein [Silvanigrella paludirubra]KAB8039915.1 hypothetical protein GCL60_06540 [Silvanigrella paludirubra]
MRFLEDLNEKYVLNKYLCSKIYNFNQEDYVNKFKDRLDNNFSSGLCLGFTYLFAKFLSNSFLKNNNISEFISYLETPDFIHFLEVVMSIQKKYINAKKLKNYPERKQEIELKRNLRKLIFVQSNKKEFKSKFEEIVQNYINNSEETKETSAIEVEFINKLKNSPKNNIRDKYEIDTNLISFSKQIQDLNKNKLNDFQQINKENILNYLPINADEEKIERLSLYLSMDLNFLKNNFYHIHFNKIYPIFEKIEFHPDLLSESNILNNNNIIFRTIALPTKYGGHSICYALTKKGIYLFDSNYGLYSFPIHKIKNFSEFLSYFILNKYKFNQNEYIISNSFILNKYN